MTDLTPIEQLTIDETTFRVADLPQEIQAAVRKYEEWRERYVVAQDEVQLVSAALRDLGSQLVAAVRAVEQSAAQAEQAPAASEELINSSSLTPAVEIPAGDTLVVDDVS